MIKISNRKYDELKVEATVHLSIPDVDHARGLSRNVLAVKTKSKKIYTSYVSTLVFLLHLNHLHILSHKQ